MKFRPLHDRVLVKRVEQEEKTAKFQQELESERLEQAKQLEAQGEKDAALALLDAPIVAPTVTTPVTKVDGVSTSKIWGAEVYSLKELCQAIVDGKADISCVEANMKTLNSLCKALKANVSIPGVRAICKTVVRGRAA